MIQSCQEIKYLFNYSQKDITLNRILSIHYLLYFSKSKDNIEALPNFGHKINIVTTGYILKLDY